jgi:hypothetical protein
MGVRIGAYMVWWGTGWKETTGKTKEYLWEDNIKMGVQEMVWALYGIELAQGRGRGRTFVKAIMNLSVPYNATSSLASSRPFSFSGKTLICRNNKASPFLRIIHTCTSLDGARGGIVVKVLCYKPAGRGFDSRLCHWNFTVV